MCHMFNACGRFVYGSTAEQLMDIFLRRAVRVYSLLIVVFSDSITSVISSVKVTAVEQNCLHYLQKLNGPNCFHIIATLEPFSFRSQQRSNGLMRFKSQ